MLRRLIGSAGPMCLLVAVVVQALSAESAVEPTGSDIMPCRTVEFVTQFLPHYRGYESEIPETISCVLQVRSSVPNYLLTFSNRRHEEYQGMAGWRWGVAVAPRAEPSARQLLPDVFESDCGMQVGDFDFDGFVDLALPRDFKLREGLLRDAIECRRHVLLFNPETRTFVANAELSSLIDPAFDTATKEIRDRTDDGRGGALYTMATYRLEAQRLVLYRRERRAWDDTARCIRATSEERRDGALTIAKDELIGADTADLYKPDAWELVDALRVDLAPRLRGITIAVLRSPPDATKDEYAQRFLVDVILAQEGKVLYRFSDEKLKPPAGVSPDRALHVEHGFLNTQVQLHDVTNDGMPEVVFKSGEWSGLNEVTFYHVIHCDPRTRRCWDARHPRFRTCRRDDFRWLRWKWGSIAVHATPRCDETCDFRYCPAPFEFVAYSWDAATNRFVVVRTLTTKERLMEDGIEANMSYVDRLLR